EPRLARGRDRGERRAVRLALRRDLRERGRDRGVDLRDGVVAALRRGGECYVVGRLRGALVHLRRLLGERGARRRFRHGGGARRFQREQRVARRRPRQRDRRVARGGALRRLGKLTLLARDRVARGGERLRRALGGGGLRVARRLRDGERVDPPVPPAVHLLPLPARHLPLPLPHAP